MRKIMKRIMKRITALGLAGLMSVCLLAGCGKSGEAGTGNTETGGDKQAAGEDTASTEVIPMKWYMAGSGPQADVETVEKAIDKYLMDTYKMNIDLKIIATDYSNYPQKMQMIISSGEEYDICWTSTWNNNYYDNVNKNAFVALDDLLKKDAPELLASMNTSIWDAVKVKGSIYGVPAQQIFPKQNYVVVVKEYADKYGLDMSKVEKLSDLEEFFKKVKQDNPDIYPFAASSNGLLGKNNLALGFEPIAGMNIPGTFKVGDDSLTVYNQFESNELKDFYDMIYRWVQEGLIRKDAVTVSDNAVPDMKAGKCIAAINATFKPGVETLESGNFGNKEVVFAKLSDPYLATDSLVSSLNAISQTSKHPEEAMKFLNLVNTDKTLYNLLCFGVEGTHYTVNADGSVKSDDSKGYNPNVDWMIGNQFNAFIREGQQADIWEKTKELNSTAVESKALGFAFDSTPVANEIASVSAVYDQYGKTLEVGGADPEKVLPEFIENLKTAGAEKIIKAMQEQIDEWKASK
jgi:ABC-type sugar transport system, periplasmic component